jgi:hypothetical protein
MKKTVYTLLITLLLFACEEGVSYTDEHHFGLSETNISFSSDAGEYSVEALNAGGALKAAVVSGGDSEWCLVAVNGNAILIQVQENQLVKSRTATVEVTGDNGRINLMVRQARKYFDVIPAVKELKALPGPNSVTLTWEEPEEDNFSHVILGYRHGDDSLSFTLEPGITEHTVTELLNSDGEYTFHIRSVDSDNDFGETASVTATAGKLVAFRFEKQPDTQWVPYYLRESDTFTVTLKVGSAEFDDNEKITVGLSTDETLLEEYNRTNGSAIPLLPDGTYTLAETLLYEGTVNYQDYTVELNIPAVGDRKVYALPLKITTVTSAQISETMSSTVVILYVDDLEGWYTVDRLEKNGESAGAYETEEAPDRRRYIKRTGETSWETGYLFRAYAGDETGTENSGDADVQYITFDPATGQILIRQGDYATSDDRNAFDTSANELHIEYLYKAWAGWWNHERMYARSLKK